MLARLFFLAALSAGTASALAAGQAKQYPIFTAENFVSSMKTVGQAFVAFNSSVGRNEFEDSKAYLAISRDRLATTISFWRDRKKDDAIRLLRDSLTKLDDLDAALSVEKIDPAAVAARAKQVDSSCEACHALYRDQDPATKTYRLKPGLE